MFQLCVVSVQQAGDIVIILFMDVGGVFPTAQFPLG